MLAGDAINVMNTSGAAAGVGHDIADDGITDKRKFPRPGCGGKRDRWAIEVGSRKASALALIAIVAGWASAMVHREIGDAVGHNAPAEFLFDHLLGLESAARKIHRRKKLSVGHLREAFARSADADVAFDEIVVGFEIFVPNGPVFAVAVTTGGFEFVIAEAIALARPAESFPSDLPAANPHERLVRRKCVGMLDVVDEELMTKFVARVAQALHRLRFQQALLITETSKF